jgi:ribosomal protein L11 methyltransferase
MARLILEPGLAFGTGSHPTTYLALVLLAQTLVDATHRTVLDVGCGSGILSLAALQLGAQTALGVDIEDQAIAVAEHNAALNDLQHRARFVQGSWDVTEEPFHLLTANIYLGPLVNMIHSLAQRLAPHGTLILSGILAFQESTLRTALDTAQLTVMQQMTQDNWVALAVRHRV